jgi:hypothetical protein
MAKRSARLSVDLTEGSLRIHRGDKVLTITSAAAPPDAEVTADFIVYLDEILHWDEPHDGSEIAIEDLQRIVEAIEEEFARRGLTVEFE